MKRYHLSSSDNLRVDFSRTATLDLPMFQSPYSKPSGLWYDIDMDWLRWLENEDYFDDDRWMRPFLYEIAIDDSKIRVIRTLDQFDAFQEEFSVPYELPGRTIDPWLRQTMIDWPKVIAIYGGVEIAPYLWQRRLNWESNWYYGWDCASGVIWRAEALKEIKLIASSKDEIVRMYQGKS